MIVRGAITMSAAGKPAPAALKRAMMPLATSTPEAMPMSVARTEIEERFGEHHPTHLARPMPRSPGAVQAPGVADRS